QFCLTRCCLVYRLGDPLDLHSFPTRRSSDLSRKSNRKYQGRNAGKPYKRRFPLLPRRYGGQRGFAAPAGRLSLRRAASHGRFRRSEEHTSELQSRFDLVCRLLLEKKKDTTNA